MASVERAMAKAAAALLPGLLPTPPMCRIAPCFIILPSSFASNAKPKPGRADSVGRWDAHKKPGSPSSSCSSSSSSVECWDVIKKCGSSSGMSLSSSSGIRASSATPGRASLCDRWDSNKRASSRASSADRSDIHKKPSSAESATRKQEEADISDKHPQEDEDEIMAMVQAAPRMDPVFSGSSFFVSPEPSMLPMPSFFRSRCPSMTPLPAH